MHNYKKKHKTTRSFVFPRQTRATPRDTTDATMVPYDTIRVQLLQYEYNYGIPYEYSSLPGTAGRALRVPVLVSYVTSH